MLKEKQKLKCVRNYTPVVIDRLNHSIVASDCFNFIGNVGKKGNSKNYFKKSPRTAKKITSLAKSFYELRNKAKKMIWCTITTQQHITKKLDAFYLYKMKLWLQHQDIKYVLVCERQRQTGDLHFHLLIEKNKYYDINEELNRLHILFNCAKHDALFHVRAVNNNKKLASYISKYLKKDKRKPSNENPPYSSLFWCKTFSYSLSVAKDYKKNISQFLVKTSELFLFNMRSYFEVLHKNEYNVIYKYSDYLFCQAHLFNSS